MSWPLAANWLTVAGLFLVTFGTGAQAWANLAEYASLRRTISEAALAAIAEAAGQEIIDLAARAAPVLFGPLLPLPLAAGAALFRISSPRRKRLRWLGLIPRVIWAAVIAIPAKMAQIRADGGEEAVQLARFIRLATVWTVLTAGSALALAAAVIQLALAYH